MTTWATSKIYLDKLSKIRTKLNELNKFEYSFVVGVQKNADSCELSIKQRRIIQQIYSRLF